MENKCKNLAKYRFTWPGDTEALICEEHAGQLRAVAKAIGTYIQVIPLSGGDLEMGLTCEQKV